jgi:hypothetical protein
MTDIDRVIRLIDLDEVRCLAAARCFDVLSFDQAAFGPPEVLAGEVLAGRFEPISVLRYLEAIEQRQCLSAARNNRTSDSRSSARSTARGCGWMRATDKRGRIEG